MNLNDDEVEEVEFWWKKMEEVAIVVPIIFSLVALVGVIGNSLVVYVVASNENMRSPKNLLITNLAMADLIFLLIAAPVASIAYASPHHWPLGNTYCKIFFTISYHTALVSVYTLVLISIDRFLAILYPIRSIKWRTNTNLLVAIICTWIILLLFCTPLFFSHSEMTTPSNNSYCDFRDNKPIDIFPQSWGWRWNVLQFKILFYIFGFMLPMLIMSRLYITIFNKLWNQNPVPGRSITSIQKNRQVVKVFIVVVITFAVCWIPIHIVMILRALGMRTNTPPLLTIQLISHVLACLNSCLNPIIYGFLYKPFRLGLKLNARSISTLKS